MVRTVPRDKTYSKQRLDHMSTPRLSFMRHTPDIEPSDLYRVRAECDRFEDIRAGAYTRVEDDFHLC